MANVEVLKAELARRKKSKGMTAESYKNLQPKWQDIEIKTPFSKGVNENIAGAIHGGNRGFSKVYGFGQHPKEMQRKYEQSMELNPVATELGNIGSQVAGSIPFFMGGGMGASRLAPNLGRYAQSALGGGIGGGAMGAFEQPGEDESRLMNILMGTGLGAVGGALFPAAKAAPNAIGEYGASLSQPRTVNKMAQHFQGLQNKFNQGYGDIFSNPQVPQHLDLKLDTKSVKALEKLIPGWTERVAKATKTKNPADVHWAASDLGRLINKINKRGIDATPRQQKIAEMARPIKQQFEQSLDNVLPEDLKKAYRMLDKEYAAEMGDKIPQNLRNAFKDYGKGELNPEHVLRKARSTGAEKYQTKYGNLFPGIERAMHPSTLRNAVMANKWPLGIATAGGAGYKALDLLSPSRKKEQY